MRRPVYRWIVVFFAQMPLIFYVVAGLLGYLGADPAKALIEELGFWAMIFLVASLSITPLKKTMLPSSIIVFRRTFGLLSFWYLFLHFIAWMTLFVSWRWDWLLEEVVKRPYVLVGAVAFFLLSLLAITSNKYSQRRLRRRWVLLHKLVYLSVILGLVHILWIQKAGYIMPLVFFVILVAGFAIRILNIRRVF